MKILGKYMKEHIWKFCIYIGVVLIFAIVFYLYDVRMEAVEYAFLLSFVWLVAFAVVDFMRYRRRHLELIELKARLQAQWEDFPLTKSLIEEDYQDILREIYGRKLDNESQADMNRQDMLDYYTLWVHQIKTPISAMRVLIQSQEENMAEQPEQKGADIKALKMELFKIEQYVEMVLSYLRMESISSDMVLQWYPVDMLVKQAVRKYSQIFIMQKTALKMDLARQMILTDEKWLVFVVEQILSNALKYTGKGTISIYLNGSELVIEDTGIGIKEEDLPRVFEKGFTGFNGRTDKKATGIGLYLCKSILDKLNHGIRIESKVGQGTKVYLLLGRDELHVE